MEYNEFEKQIIHALMKEEHGLSIKALAKKINRCYTTCSKWVQVLNALNKVEIMEVGLNKVIHTKVFICDFCEEEFDSKRALVIHKGMKHKE